MENGGAKMKQCNDKTNKLNKIHKNLYAIGTIFERNSYDFITLFHPTSQSHASKSPKSTM